MIKTYAEHRENLAKKPEGKFTDLWFDEIYEQICIELNDKAGMDHKHPELTDDLIKMVCDLVNDGAELLDEAEAFDESEKVLNAYHRERDQYRRGIHALDKMLHDNTMGMNLDKFLNGMTLHDFIWEAGQPKNSAPPPATQGDPK